jgi:hypothetical protein
MGWLDSLDPPVLEKAEEYCAPAVDGTTSAQPARTSAMTPSHAFRLGLLVLVMV